MPKQMPEFVVCLQNDESDDLELHKIYLVVRDRHAEANGLFRVIDESGEDYLYPMSYFAPVQVPAAAAEELRRGRAALG